jgi:hypothetical protein
LDGSLDGLAGLGLGQGALPLEYVQLEAEPFPYRCLLTYLVDSGKPIVQARCVCLLLYTSVNRTTFPK